MTVKKRLSIAAAALIIGATMLASLVGENNIIQEKGFQVADGYCKRDIGGSLVSLPQDDEDGLAVASLVSDLITEMGSCSYKTITGEEGFSQMSTRLKQAFNDDDYPARVTAGYIASELQKEVSNIWITNVRFDQDGNAFVEAGYDTTLVFCDASATTILAAGYSHVGDTKREEAMFVVIQEDGEWRIDALTVKPAPKIERDSQAV